MPNGTTEGNKLNDFESDTPKQLSDSPAGEKISGTDNNTEDIAPNASSSKAQDALLCGKKHSRAREDVRNLADKKGEISDEKAKQKEFSAKYSEQPKKMYEEKSAPALKLESSHASQVSDLRHKSSNRKEIEVNFQQTNAIYCRNELRRN